MGFTNDDLFYYNIILKNGFKEEVNNWINQQISELNQLDGILLDLAWNQNDINKLIQCFDEYLLDKEINDKEVCERLRLFILDKTITGEVKFEVAADYLHDFAISSNKEFDEYWDELYTFVYNYDYVEMGFLTSERYIKELLSFLECGEYCRKISVITSNYIEDRKMEGVNEYIKNIRSKYNIPNDIYTNYEYFSIFYKNNLPSKKKWLLCILFELVALLIFIGSPFYFETLGSELSTIIMICGLPIAIYGFALLCGYPKKGIKYSLLPVLCFAIPLFFLRYILQIRIMWVNGVFTILIGVILFYLFLYNFVIKPQKEYNKISSNYFNELVEKYPNINHFKEFVNFILWKKDGSHVVICKLQDELYSIVLIGNVIIDDVLLKDKIIHYEEMKDSYDECIKKAIIILESYCVTKKYLQ